ncbi:hypothetical protein AX774_g6085 [Zancudomyces culisetae]|uniref:Secreted protein n=1 Tax=Zancudomyces culisetae TaxID=1213189 RepID=A0A1R1PHE9_ZANCU|nr:hypothetical protein AX774_g6201 [Zancudomyces culisetae]OMH80472.1 hypothetical protein AX774_g6085 [Zancudomyces culisetae]|eukprot:OMH80367.1 hypothetical protein AX774_g6201 [Zancudomyces culisetae]
MGLHLAFVHLSIFVPGNAVSPASMKRFGLIFMYTKNSSIHHSVVKGFFEPEFECTICNMVSPTHFPRCRVNKCF